MNKIVHKLNIFEVLKNITKSNVTYWDTLDPTQQKAFVPLVVMRWLTGTDKFVQIHILNEIVNPFIFTLGKHPRLLYNLMCSAAHGNTNKYTWLKRNNNKNINFKISFNLLSEYLNCSKREVKELFQFYSNEDLLEIADDLGLQKNDIKKLKDELKKR